MEGNMGVGFPEFFVFGWFECCFAIFGLYGKGLLSA
jgi:hypothetical protein